MDSPAEMEGRGQAQLALYIAEKGLRESWLMGLLDALPLGQPTSLSSAYLQPSEPLRVSSFAAPSPSILPWLFPKELASQRPLTLLSSFCGVKPEQQIFTKL